MKRIILLIILLSLVVPVYSNTQNEDIKVSFQKFLIYYSSGDLVNAKVVLLSILESNKPIPEEYMVAIYNNLGAINTMMGSYREALEYNNKAETLINLKSQKSQALADIYNNKAFIYNVLKSFDLSIEYLEKSIRIYKDLDNSNNKSILQSLSSAYLNIGIVYYEIKNYKIASEYLNKSADLKLKYNLTELSLIYLNIAKNSSKTGDLKKAEEFYIKSISSFKKEFGEYHFRMAEAYFDYGLFLKSGGRYNEELDAYRKALLICLRNYGEKHTLVSLAYKHIGDHYLNQKDYDSSLYYYQKSLIAVVKNFNDQNIFANPSIDSAIFDIRLLDNLKSKSQALEFLADQQSDPEIQLKTTQKSFETIELGLKLIDRIRNNFLSEESRIYLAENEKETYVFATHLAFSLFSLTKSDSTGLKMYDIAKKAKAAILRNEITENELLYSAGIPDSLQKKRNSLSGDIAAYNNLILEELRKKDFDNKKISLWKDALFEMNRSKEVITDQIYKLYPQIKDLLRKTEPVAVSEMQKQLIDNETVIDYLLSNKYSEGYRKLYIFLITKDRLQIRENNLDSIFTKSANIIREVQIQSQTSGESDELFRNYTTSLNYMYENLFKPVEGLTKGNRVIIIPDEEIAWLPFDAFLKSKPAPGQSDYEGLQYLIDDYIFSYGYSSSLIFGKESKKNRREEVYAFSPDYNDGGLSAEGHNSLQGAGAEIDFILTLFKGKKYTGKMATESNFRESMKNPVIFHLAMHSLADSSNSKYSYMLFDPESDSINDGKLYNYEISISRIRSPMVVLSTCNSGSGTLYHGEGLMSLARGFILAGASSVIKTAWEVNDEASATIIDRFYFYLSKGKSKDEALRLSKLEFLKSNTAHYANPYYWAAYEVLGDSSPVVQKKHLSLLVMIIVILILSAGLLIIYFKRLRIFSDRSL